MALTDRSAYARFLERVGQAMIAPDPAAALLEIASDAELPEEYRQAVAYASADGVRLSALLVAKLRFEQLINFSPRAAHNFATDPAGFAALFRRYHAAVAAAGRFPSEDAHRFEAWLDD